MNDEMGQLVRPSFIFHLSSFITHPSTLLPAADLEAFANERFIAKRRAEQLQAITTEGEIIDVFTAAGSSAPTARDRPAQRAGGRE